MSQLPPVAPAELRARTLAERYRQVRAATEAWAEPLSDEDCALQSMPDASPVKWHLAHTTWFFETFLLLADGGPRRYQAFDPAFRVLFNSYYQGVGERHPRSERGLVSRPSRREVMRYRRQVDEAMLEWLDAAGAEAPDPIRLDRVELGLHHEQQHQELLLTDLLHLFSRNPSAPVYRPGVRPATPSAGPAGWQGFDAGLRTIGRAPDAAGFAFDNETPAHRVWLDAFELADRPVTQGQWLAFMADGGYRRPELWLSDGWDQLQRSGWEAPAYWRRRTPVGPSSHAVPDAADWCVFGLHGEQPLHPDDPVSQVSFFEAEAFARWAGARLPTEAEWEHAACSAPIGSQAAPAADSGWLQPLAPPGPLTEGGVWCWTRSDYAPYPGFRPAPGAIGEYNGKFMNGQYVLRGASCATPRGHARSTYRNFFPPAARWQFTGLRLAR